jgi:hypothetical protein
MIESASKKRVVTLVSVIPNLVGGQGHPYPYHLAVGKASDLIGWNHIGLTAADPKIKDLPNNWKVCFKEDLELEIHPILRAFRFIAIYKWANSLAKELNQKSVLQSDYAIVFVERFNLLQLLALVITSLLVPKNNLFVWLLYRRDTHKHRVRIIYKILNRLIINIFPKGRVKLFTDSELLAKSLSNYFSDPVTVMPIPHTEIISFEQGYFKEMDETVCWFAGAPRLEKGVELVRRLSTVVSAESKKLRIVAAASSKLADVVDGPKVHLIEDSLTRNDYLHWLSISDLILLPYDHEAYSERTSGVFVECVIAGKITVVTQGTWMASELSKYDLNELVLDWLDDALAKTLVQIAHDQTIKAKVIEMQRAYQKFHHIQAYAEIMEASLLNVC